jgi:hypothetical protein
MQKFGNELLIEHVNKFYPGLNKIKVFPTKVLTLTVYFKAIFKQK